MSINLQDFEPGDTNYISKMNSNNAILENAINSLQAAGSAGEGDDSGIGLYLKQLFGSVTSLIGPGSYKPTQGGTTLTFAAGTAYIAVTESFVQKTSTTAINFSGQPADTYYISINGSGTPTRSTSPSSSDVYTIVWSGSSFSSITRTAPAIFDGDEMDDARKSAAKATNYDSLDARLEALETDVEDIQTIVGTGGGKVHKVGITIDGQGSVITTGMKATAIQVDFDGTIIGWSAIADQLGDIEVEVYRGRESPVAVPPADPPIPVDPGDKISASAPITILDSPPSQSAAGSSVEVSSWDTDIQAWDTIQFKVISVTGLEIVTLYIRIQEAVG